MSELLLKDATDDEVEKFLNRSLGADEVTEDGLLEAQNTVRARRSFVESRPFEEQIVLREEPVLSFNDKTPEEVKRDEENKRDAERESRRGGGLRG